MPEAHRGSRTELQPKGTYVRKTLITVGIASTALVLSACGGATIEDATPEREEPVAAAGTYGSDPVLDALWDACEGSDDGACEDLYYDSPVDSEYEGFGWDNMAASEIPLPPEEVEATYVLNGTEMTMDEAIGEMVLLVEYMDLTELLCYEDEVLGSEQSFDNFWTGWQTTNDDLTKAETKVLYEGTIAELC